MHTPEISKDQLAALWESGVPLDQAWVEFAKFFDSYAHRALRTYPSNDPDVLAGDPRYNELRSWLPKTWEGRKEKLLVTTRNERYHLLGEIYAGRLWAIGFRTLPNGSDEPVRVPRQHFFFEKGVGQEIDIRWAICELRAGDASYFDIRIVKPPVVAAGEPSESARPDMPMVAETLPEGTDAIEVPAPTGAKVRPAQRDNASLDHASAARKEGRPNKRKEILRKVEELWKDPFFQAISNRTDQAREVRARLCNETARHLDDMQGYRTTQIKRIIGEVANKRTEA